MNAGKSAKGNKGRSTGRTRPASNEQTIKVPGTAFFGMLSKKGQL